MIGINLSLKFNSTAKHYVTIYVWMAATGNSLAESMMYLPNGVSGNQRKGIK